MTEFESQHANQYEYMMTEKLSPKEVNKRLKFKEQLQKKIAIAQKGVDKAEDKLYALRNSCPHYDSYYKNKGSTGGWDYADSYWREYECLDCGSKWRTDQDRKFDIEYPYSEDRTYK